MQTDIEIAQAAKLQPIVDIAAKVGLSASDLIPFGHYMAKIPLDAAPTDRKGKLVLVTGVSPTPAGEGKSTVSVGLADAFTLRERNPVLCIREPSLGPVFGVKGGAAGGGHSQVLPMEEINLHFTGDLHAITAAHALLSAVLDNHLYRPNTLGFDPAQITWKRAVDMNDRALRKVVIGLGGRTGGVPREDGFVITAASEVMAIFCLADGVEDLTRRLDRMILGYTKEGEPIRAAGLGVSGAMTLLLRAALNPNLVQTIGGTPALVHGGPFANIAHGCNSLAATRMGLQLGDVVVTEAGFGADLGAEKFFDIKCRAGGLTPAAAVVVSTIRSVKMHGGVARADLDGENLDAIRAGFPNLEAHVENVGKFGVPAVIAINRFPADTDAEVQLLLDLCSERGFKAIACRPWDGGKGCLDLADEVWSVIERGESEFKPLYPLDLGLVEKIETIARRIYGADGVDFDPAAVRSIERLEAAGLGSVPVCIAKTQYSLSDDPKRLGRPTGFRLTVKDVTPSAGAGFVVALTGDIMTMPGLGAVPAATRMGVDSEGNAVGLF